MRGAVLFSLAACFAFTLMAMTSLSQVEAAPTPTPVAQASEVRGLSVDDLPPAGQCRIWYDELPAAKQPARMECEHAHWVARSWGGRVIVATATGASEVATYEGRNDFTGIPTEALPPAGYCRAWLADTAVEAQPQYGDCREARRTAEAQNGRVVFMPL